MDASTIECSESPVKFHSNNEHKSLICAAVLDNAGCVRAGWSYKNFETSILTFLSHPALVDRVAEEKKIGLRVLAAQIREVALADEERSSRIELSQSIRQVVSHLSLACAGLPPANFLPGALVRRNHPRRVFKIKIFESLSYEGWPIDNVEAMKDAKAFARSEQDIAAEERRHAEAKAP
jgi:hypothetical protein